jgi:Transmembrane secretion effector
MNTLEELQSQYRFSQQEWIDERRQAVDWLDYLRQLDRMTNVDHSTEDHARSFHQGSAPPAVTPLIAEHPNWNGAPDRME